MYIYTSLCRYWITLFRFVLVFIVPHVDIEPEDNKQFISNIPRIYLCITFHLYWTRWQSFIRFSATVMTHPFDSTPICVVQNWLARQYLPSCAAVATLIFLCIEFIRVLILAMEMLSLFSNKACLSWAKLVGAFGTLLTLLSNSSNKCSMGDRTGLNAVQLSGFTLLLARNCWASWGRALSCWKIKLRACTHGTATGRRISSLYMFIILGQATKYLLHILCIRRFFFGLAYIKPIEP